VNKYLLLNRGILNGHWLDNVKLSVNPLQKDVKHNPLFKEDFFSIPPRKWEVRYDNGYPNVIYDSQYKKFRCYYTVFTYDKDSSETPLPKRVEKHYQPSATRVTSLCYAESEDGINWSKPNLGLISFDGSKENNILIENAHGAGVFLDEEEMDPAKRYKLVTKMRYSKQRNFMAVAFSEDGIHFDKLIEWPRYNPPADTHNFVFRDGKTGKFKLITRIWRDGVRIPAICESSDFINWSEPEEIMRGDGFQNQVYSMPVFQYGDIYLGLASIYHGGDRSAENFDLVDVELKFATSVEHWDSVGKGQYFIPRGKGNYPTGDFDCGCTYAAAPIEIENKLCFYYMGSNGPHTDYRETSFARGFMEKDKFAYYETKDENKEGILVTNSFTVYGDYLSILTESGEDGKLDVSLNETSGIPYKGYEAENCILTKEDNGYMRINFKDKNLKDLRAKPVIISIKFKNARIFALAGDLELNKGE